MWEDAGQESDSDEERQLEGRIPRRVKGSVQPSEREVEDHMATHVPFRSWCPYCVAGKAGSSPHATRKDE